MPKRKQKRSLKKQVRSNKRQISLLRGDAEYKRINLRGTDVNINTTGIVMALGMITQGDSSSERIGTSVTAKNLHIRGVFHNDNGTPEDTVVRVIIMREIQNDTSDAGNGALPAIDTIINDNGTPDVISTYYTHKQRNFVKYWDQTFAMDTSVHTKIPFKYTKKLNSKIHYRGSTATIASAERGMLYMVLIGDVIGTTNCPQLDLNSRLSFTDS